MSGDFLSAKTIAGVDEAIGTAVHIGIVDLGGVADHDELRSLGHAGDHGFGLKRRELLGLVEDEEAVWDGAATDVAEGLDLKQSALDELFVGLERFLAGSGGFLLLGGLALLLFPLGGMLAALPLGAIGMKRHEDLKDRKSVV